MTDSRCKTCRFWKIFDEECGEIGGMGDCYRFPPQPVALNEYGDVQVERPMVAGIDWCGEWQKGQP